MHPLKRLLFFYWSCMTPTSKGGESVNRMNESLKLFLNESSASTSRRISARGNVSTDHKLVD
jgi:hypothetical protein